MANHILLLKTKLKVCEHPELLGNDFVYVDSTDEMACKDCLAVLITHNQREYDIEQEMAMEHNARRNTPASRERSMRWWRFFVFVLFLITLGVLVWAVRS